MISEMYNQQLIKLAKSIDNFSNKEKRFETLVREIVDGQVEFANLQLIQALGDLENLNKKNMQSKEVLLESLYKYHGSLKIEAQIEAIKTEATIEPQKYFDQLNELVGLEDVKQMIKDLIVFQQIQKLREKQGLKTAEKTLHMAFLGNPGTAKTTVARILGRLYQSLGFLSKGHFIEVGRTDLIAEYQGQTAIKVKCLIERAKGGVLFIDEAYSITENESADSYGRESLTELTKALEDNRNDLVVIVAGYPELMENFFASNPGLKSRFNTFLYFADYHVEELFDIFNLIAKQNDYIIEQEAGEALRLLMTEEIEVQEPNFANGRYVRNLFDDIIMNQSKRLIKVEREVSKQELSLIKKVDISSHV